MARVEQGFDAVLVSHLPPGLWAGVDFATNPNLNGARPISSTDTAISNRLAEDTLRSSRRLAKLGFVESLKQYESVSVEDYLASELHSEIKHEYLGGVVYAMSGARNRHNRIVMNLYGLLWSALRGTSCQPYNSDTKIRIRLPHHVRFYYPDASVICRSNPMDESFQDEPVMIVEVLSKRTRRLDEGEKKDAYLTIPSLMLYLLVEQDSQAVQLFRRTAQGFLREIYADGVIPLPEINCQLPLSEIYQGVQ